MTLVKRVWLFATWASATVLVSIATFHGLSAAQGQVNDRPLTPVVIASTSPVVAGQATSTTTPRLETDSRLEAERPGTSTTTSEDDGTEPRESSGSPSGTDSPTSTTSPPTTSTTAGEAGSTSTTSTTATLSTAWTTVTIDSPGGSVTVSYRPGEVRYDAAIPAAGFGLDVEETGPEVEVQFVGQDDQPDYEIRARWNDGAFDADVSEKG